MFSLTFIKRPILAMVISLLIMVGGLVSMVVLPIQEFPDVVPPTVQVSATYTGANAYAVEESVTRPLEDKLNGVQGSIYIESASTSAGQSVITVYFEPGYDLDIAAVDVQNKVSLATPSLPAEVKQQGVIVDKKSPSMVCAITILGDERYDAAFLSNYTNINVLDEIKRIPGVGKAENMGEKKYAMRIWLDPDKIAALSSLQTILSMQLTHRTNKLPSERSVVHQPTRINSLNMCSVQMDVLVRLKSLKRSSSNTKKTVPLSIYVMLPELNWVPKVTTLILF